MPFTRKERQTIYEKAIDHYGVTRQLWKAVEEMSELTKELAKYAAAGETTREALIDEIADVTVMMEQLRLIFGVDASVRIRVDYKAHRLLCR